MRRPIARLALLLLPLLVACSEEESSPLGLTERNLAVPGEYASIGAAAAAANPGDKIIVEYRLDAYAGDLTLPAGVTLMGHNDNPLMPVIEGGITVVGGDADAALIDLKIVNENGPGVVLQDSNIELRKLWIEGCDGAGIELRGDSHALVTTCDIENCARGILITGVTQPGDYADDLQPAAVITDTNFIADGEPGALDNIRFEDTPVDYRISVNLNYWGEDVVDPDDTIWDNKDDADIKGLAHTGYEDFLRWPAVIASGRWWRD